MNRPEIRELECFLAVAEQLNFSKAARQMNLSQPPLTRHVQALEAKLGVRLFERDTRSVALTRAGSRYLEEVRTLLGRLDQAGESASQAGGDGPDRLRLSFVGALLDPSMLRVIQAFRERRPRCRIEIADLPPAAQMAALRAGEIDGCFLGAKPAAALRGVLCRVWRREPLLLALPERHALAGARNVRWSDLRPEPWVMVSREAAPAFRQQFSQLAARHALAGGVVQEADRVPAILAMVAAGNGISLLPEMVRRLIDCGVVFRPLPKPAPHLSHAFACSAEPSGPLRDFLEVLRSAG